MGAAGTGGRRKGRRKVWKGVVQTTASHSSAAATAGHLSAAPCLRCFPPGIGLAHACPTRTVACCERRRLIGEEHPALRISPRQCAQSTPALQPPVDPEAAVPAKL